MSIVSGSKLEFRVLLLTAGGKLNIPERNRRTTNSTHLWSQLQESNPCRSGAVLSPPFTKKYSVQKLRMTWVTRLQFTRAWPWPLRERRKYAVSLKYIEKNSLPYPPPTPDYFHPHPGCKNTPPHFMQQNNPVNTSIWNTWVCSLLHFFSNSVIVPELYPKKGNLVYYNHVQTFCDSLYKKSESE